MSAIYKTTAQAASQLGVSERTIRNWCETFEWFGGRLGDTATWVLTQAEIDQMKMTPRPSAGRPRQPIGVAG